MSIKTTLTSGHTASLHHLCDASLTSHDSNDIECPESGRYFLKKVVSSSKKRSFSKTLEHNYGGVQFNEVSGSQPATLQKINSVIDMKQRFQRRIHKNLPLPFNIFDKCKQLFN